jgi:transcriptional antiterminator NusG
MAESTESEMGENQIVVDGEQTTELAHAEADLEEETAGANDVGAGPAADSETDVAANADVEEEDVAETVGAEETQDSVADVAVSAEAVAEPEAEAEEEDAEKTVEDEETQDSEADVAVSAEAEAAAGAEEEDAEETGEGEDEESEKEPERPEGVAWFVVHSYSGYENKVKKNLEHRIESMGMLDQIFQVVVPTEEEVELRDGQRRTTERRVFPGYILVEMLMNDDTWYVVRNTPGVTDFVRSGTKPIPLRQEEVDKILNRMEAEAPKIKVSFREGQKVRIVDGPFEDFMGSVDAIDTDRARVRVLVNMFGRETPVEVDFLQVERV